VDCNTRKRGKVKEVRIEIKNSDGKLIIQKKYRYSNNKIQSAQQKF
jgi:hypothetical protein